MRFTCVWIILVSTLATGTASGGADEPIVTSDLLRLRSATSIDISPDGSHAVYAVRSIAEERPSAVSETGEYTPAKYSYRSHLFLIDLTTNDAQPVQLTFGARLDTSPFFSPNGQSVAFVRSPVDSEDGSSDDDTEKPKGQVWLLPLTGGEARPITDFEFGAGSPRWSPDGRHLLVSSDMPLEKLDGTPTWNLERPERTWKDTVSRTGDNAVSPRPDGTREEIRAWLEATSKNGNPVVTTRLDFQEELGLKKDYTFAQLFLIDVNEASEHPLSGEQAQQLTRDFCDHEDARFMPGGERVIYAARKSDDEHLDRIRQSRLYAVRVDGSEHGLFFELDGWSIDSPRPSVDGSVIAFGATQLDEPNYRQRIVGLIPSRLPMENEPVWLTDSLDRSVSAFEWQTAKGALIFTAANEGAFPLYTISPGLVRPKRLTEGEVGVHAFAVGPGAIVYAETSPINPSVLKAETERLGRRTVHDLNAWVNQKRRSFPEPGWLDRPDGTRVQYWIMAPANARPGERYPLCLAIHGGPSAMWGPGEASMWFEFQLLASWGYGVVYANPRGSGGYGYDFQRANHENWGRGPGGDVLAAVDAALSKAWVHPEQLVVTGGSYAGYLTAWIVANDHRFSAAVAQRGVYDLTTFFGEGNAWRLVEWAMGGHPWDATTRRVLQRESPFSAVRSIRTPLLIMHASNDLRTGVSQSEMLYRALKVLKKPVEYVRYPNAGHDLSRTGDPLQRMDRLNRIIEFFDRYASPPRPAPVIEQSSPTGEQHAK